MRHMPHLTRMRSLITLYTHVTRRPHVTRHIHVQHVPEFAEDATARAHDADVGGWCWSTVIAFTHVNEDSQAHTQT